MWSLRYRKCITCGSDDKKHVARGLCVTCYGKHIDKKHTGKKVRAYHANILITKEYLNDKYLRREMSICDIANESGCTRQNIYHMLKKYDIPIRKLQLSRKMALMKGKLKFDRDYEDGTRRQVQLQCSQINERFFKIWSPEMAYVLGLVYTDGNITPGTNKSPNAKTRFTTARLTFGQKEPELLEKIQALMHSKATILFRKRSTYNGVVAGEMYYFHMHSDVIYDDLTAIGLMPNKSLQIRFPIIHKEYLRHFIRGCWDGDGSISYDKHSNRFKASFVSGSLEFISRLAVELEESGFPKRRIYKQHNTYEIKFSGGDVGKLYEYLYKDVSENMYLKRKYILFRKSTGLTDISG